MEQFRLGFSEYDPVSIMLFVHFRSLEISRISAGEGDIVQGMADPDRNPTMVSLYCFYSIHSHFLVSVQE